jgi:4-amino-4-deoxy-L-arabinose transferase-like glycosyltransferase
VTSPGAPLEGSSGPVPHLRRRFLEPVLVGLLALTLNLAGNGRISLWNRDEPRYACAVREMRARGDWILPTFNDKPRYQKPILIYWLMGACVALGGDNPFGMRLASALAGTATCLLVGRLGARMFGRHAGLTAALIAATSPLLVAESKLATTDATLTFLVVGCQLCLWELTQRASWRWAACFWVLLALAILTKGPIAPMILVAAGLASWWFGGPLPNWKRFHVRWGVLGCVLLVAPWYVTIGVVSRGEFFRVAVGDQLVRRLTYGVENHRGLPGYYLLGLLLTFYPWSSLLPPAVFGAWARRRNNPALAFLLGWAIGPLLLFECVPTKLVHYYAPALPACALLVAWLIVALVHECVSLRRWPLGRLASGLFVGIAMALMVGLIAGVVILPGALRGVCFVLAAVLALGTLWSGAAFQRGATGHGVLGLVATWAAMLGVTCAALLPAAEPYRTSQIVGERLKTLAAEQHAWPVLLGFQEPAIIYAVQQPVSLIRSWPELYGELQQHGRLVTAALPVELEKLRADPRLELEVRDRLEGFVLSDARQRRLDLVVIGERKSAALARSQETLVK